MPPKKGHNSDDRDANDAPPTSNDTPASREGFSQVDVTTLINTLQRTQLDAFRELLDSVRQSASPTFDHRPTSNFSRCKALFSGRADESVEGFIDAVESYREAANVPDDVAVKGISMLLSHTAATWWQGVKHQISTWSDVISNLRSAFGDRRPPHRIYIDLFADSQKLQENTDMFIARARALLAYLPRGDLSQKVELDMVYGLLHYKIRKRLRREEFSDFNGLLQKARSIEDSTKESQYSSAETTKSATAVTVTRARPKSPPPASAAAQPPSQRAPSPPMTKEATPRQRTSGDNTDITPTADKHRYCVYCKNYGHTRENCRKLLAKQSANDSINDNNAHVGNSVNNIKCYGCGESGVIRSNCSKCNSNFNAVDFIQTSQTLSSTTSSASAYGKPSTQVSNFTSPKVCPGVVSDLCTRPINNFHILNVPRSECSDDKMLFISLSRPVIEGESRNCTHIPSEFKSVSPRVFIDNQCIANTLSHNDFSNCKQSANRGDQCPSRNRVTMNFSGQNRKSGDQRRVTTYFSGHDPGISKPVRVTTKFDCKSITPLSSVGSLHSGKDRRPILGIEILGIRGTGYIDTAAKRSVAGSSLYALLQQHNQPFVPGSMRVKLADGSTLTRQMLSTTLDVKIIQGKSVTIEFLVFPDARDNDTLLGIDFLVAAGLAINFATSTWQCYGTERVFPLEFEYPNDLSSCSAADFLREDEGPMLIPHERDRLASLLKRNEDVFRPGGEPTPNAEHHIDTGEHPPISVPAYRLMRPRKEVLKPKKFMPKRDGPCRISKIVSPTTYEMTDLNSQILGKFHASDLKPHHYQSGQISAPVQPRRLRGRPRHVVCAEPLTRRSSVSEGEDITGPCSRSDLNAPAATSSLPTAPDVHSLNVNERARPGTRATTARPTRVRKRPARFVN